MTSQMQTLSLQFGPIWAPQLFYLQESGRGGNIPPSGMFNPTQTDSLELIDNTSFKFACSGLNTLIKIYSTS